MNLLTIPVYELSRWPDIYPHFVEMAELCEASFKLNMFDIDGVVILGSSGKQRISEISANREFVTMFRNIFEQTYSLWREGHNIFFTDADALCVRPLEVFGVYNYFRLFSKAEGDRFTSVFPAYMLSGSRYFPSSMDEKLWEVGRDIWLREADEESEVFGSHWDYEQYVYNHMFFNQNEVREQVDNFVDNDLNLYYEWEDEFPDAKILSYNTSASWRGQSELSMKDRLQLMKDRMSLFDGRKTA